MDEQNTIGAALRRAREQRGLSLEDVAAATRVRLEFLKLIEAMDTRGLPETPFALGFVRAYANEVGVNAQDAAQAFAVQTAAHQRPAPPQAMARSPREPLPLRLIAAGCGAVAVAGMISWGFVTAGGPRPSDDIPPVPEALGAWVAAEPGSAHGARALAALTAEEGPVLTLHARIGVWVEVKSALGDQVFVGELSAGDVYSLPGQPGLLVTTRNAGALEIYRDGQFVAALGEPGLPATDWAVDAVRFPSFAGLTR